jgi:hypothetical protein
MGEVERQTILKGNCRQPELVQEENVEKNKKKRRGEKRRGWGETRTDNRIDDRAQTATKGKVGPSFYGSRRLSGIVPICSHLLHFALWL